MEDGVKVEQGRRGSADPAGRAGEPIRTAVRQPGAEAAAQPGAEAATEPAPRPARKAATRRTRVADVAAQAGVSKTAVSFAFNSPERLNAETAAKILEVADELGYRPPPAAHATVGKNTMTIGLLTPQVLSGMFGDPFYTELSAGVAAQTDGAGYGLLFVSRRNGSLNRAIGRGRVDGFIVVGLAEDQPEVEQIRRTGLPMALIDRTALPEHASVESNDEVGARTAARHLLALGHREFVVIAVEPPNVAGAFDYAVEPADIVAWRRLTGYRQGLELGGVKLRDERIVAGPSTFDGGVAAFQRIWDDGLRPTAILAMSDALAIGVMWAARELGLRVPEDLSVVGFDDLEMAPHSNPPLTTVHQPIRGKGEEAARLLLRMIANPDLERPEHKTLDTRLIIRASTALARPRNRIVPRPLRTGLERGALGR